MDELLTQDVDFPSFPPPVAYIKGIPIVTYEGILVNNCHRLNLYQVLKNGYNHRALSTLNVENFFGDMTSMEYSGLGCPRGMDIFHLMSHSLQLHVIDLTLPGNLCLYNNNIFVRTQLEYNVLIWLFKLQT